MQPSPRHPSRNLVLTEFINAEIANLTLKPNPNHFDTLTQGLISAADEHAASMGGHALFCVLTCAIAPNPQPTFVRQKNLSQLWS